MVVYGVCCTATYAREQHMRAKVTVFWP